MQITQYNTALVPYTGHHPPPVSWSWPGPITGNFIMNLTFVAKLTSIYPCHAYPSCHNWIEIAKSFTFIYSTSKLTFKHILRLYVWLNETSRKCTATSESYRNFGIHLISFCEHVRSEEAATSRSSLWRFLPSVWCIGKFVLSEARSDFFKVRRLRKIYPTRNGNRGVRDNEM